MTVRNDKTNRKRETILRADGYRLATAEILYWMPDHPGLLQSFVWQHYDHVPDYPRLHQFLDYWRKNIEATLHSVEVAAIEILSPPRYRSADLIKTVN